jgi:hypothetical protein
MNEELKKKRSYKKESKDRTRKRMQEAQRRLFSSRVPFLEIVAVELGRTGHKRAVRELLGVLESEGLPGRGEAAIGLGNAAKSKRALFGLLEALNDHDPWVRLMAYRALRFATGEDYFADWLYGTAADRSSAVAKYRRFILDTTRWKGRKRKRDE